DSNPGCNQVSEPPHPPGYHLAYLPRKPQPVLTPPSRRPMSARLLFFLMYACFYFFSFFSSFPNWWSGKRPVFQYIHLISGRTKDLLFFCRSHIICSNRLYRNYKHHFDQAGRFFFVFHWELLLVDMGHQ